MAGQTERLLARARDRFTVQDYYGAIYLLEEIVATGRAFADVHHLIGVSLSLLGRSEEALTQFRHALELNPRYLEALIHQGLVLSELGRAAEAEEAFRRAAESVAPSTAGLPAPVAARLANQHAELADAYAEAGALARAIEQYERALELGPGFQDLRYRMARVMLEAGRPLEARDALEAGPRGRGPTSSTRRPRSASRISSPATASGRATSGGPASRAGPRMRGSRPTWRCWDAPARECRLGRARRRGVAAGRQPGGACGRRRPRARGRPGLCRRTLRGRARGVPPAPGRTARPRRSGPRSAPRRCTRTSCARRRTPTCGWPADDPTRADEAAEGLEAVARAAERAGNGEVLREVVTGLQAVAPERATGRYALILALQPDPDTAELVTLLPGALAAATAPETVDSLLALYGRALEATAGCGQALLQYRAVLRRSQDSSMRAPARRSAADCAYALGARADSARKLEDAALWFAESARMDSSTPTGRRALLRYGGARLVQGDTLAAALAFQTVASGRHRRFDGRGRRGAAVARWDCSH